MVSTTLSSFVFVALSLTHLQDYHLRITKYSLSHLLTIVSVFEFGGLLHVYLVARHVL